MPLWQQGLLFQICTRTLRNHSQRRSKSCTITLMRDPD
uniref:Ribonucleoside-diphosphate reductase large subunit-like n=1 Tax=Rhizophora mucronata TaxID=61149 RepID=A0A2P2QNR1_RHIMU